MGWRGTVVLAIAVLAAAAVLYRELAAENADFTWRSLIAGRREAPPSEQLIHLLSFDPATVREVRLRHANQDYRTQRTGTGWSGVERSSDVDDFLTELLELAEVMPLDVAADELDDHGLDPPAGVIELERNGQPPVVLFLGRRNPAATGVYAQVGPGGRVVLTGALAIWDFEKALRALSPSAAPQ